MDTTHVKVPMLPELVDVYTALNMTDGAKYTIQNTGGYEVIFGEYADGNIPDPFDGHYLGVRREWKITAKDAKHLRVGSLASTSRLSVSEI